MTDIVEAPVIHSTRVARALATGVLGGFGLGVVARAWMRFVTTTPEFTWNGTMFIVVGFTIFGLAQTASLLGRRRARRTAVRRAARVVGAIGLVPLFGAAGGMMLPTVVGGGFAVARTEWPKTARVIALLVAAVPVSVVSSDIVGDFGWSVHSVVAIGGLVALYGTIVRVARPTFALPDGATRLPRVVTIVGFVALCLPVAFMTIGITRG